MIKPYTGPVGAEFDEAVYAAEKAGYTVVALEEYPDAATTVPHRYVLTTKKVAGIQVSEVLSVTGFLQTHGKH